MMRFYPVRRGLTILEVMLATTVFSILAGIVFYIFSVSAQSWIKVRQTVEVKESAQVIFSRIGKEIRGTSFDSVEVMSNSITGVNDTISFLSAINPSTGRSSYNDSGEMIWQKYIIFYIKDDPKYLKSGYYELWSREVDLDIMKDKTLGSISTLPYPPDDELNSPVAFSTYITMADDSWISAPRPVSRNITHLEFSLDNTSLEPTVEILIKTGKPVKPNDASSEDSPEKLELRGLIVSETIFEEEMNNLKIQEINEREKGFALLTVLLLTALILILLISLMSLSSQTLYQATIGVERQSIAPVAEAAVNEVLLNMQNSSTWGTGNEKLYMRAGGQDPNVAGVNPGFSPNSSFSFQGKSCYYVSFDQGDTSFNGTKYYSVNNLGNSSAVPSWRGIDIPPYSASIVVSIAVGTSVRHVEAIVTVTPSGSFMKQGSRGEAKFTGKDFIMEKVGGSASPEFHSNYGTGSDVSVEFDLTDTIQLKDGTTISSTGIISSTKAPADPNSFKENDSSQNVPMVPITDLVDTISFEPSPIPSGTYKRGSGQTLEYIPDDGGASVTYNKGDSIVPGFKWDGEGLEVSGNLKVDYDPNNADNITGNLKIVPNSSGNKVKEITFKNKSSIYAPGDDVRDTSDSEAPYEHGSIYVETADNVLIGKGNLYAKGNIELHGNKIDAGANTDDIALYAGGDINVNIVDFLTFQGLIYTFGDFNCEARKVEISGAILAAGKDPNTDPTGYSYDPGTIKIVSHSNDSVKIKFDDSKLNALAGSGGGSISGIRFLSWHEF